MKELLFKLYQENSLEKDEIIYILNNIDKKYRKLLFELAVKARLRYYGRGVFMRGLIEFSNICRNDCMYCGIRAPNTNAQRYRLMPEEILECCREGYRLGYRTFVLQSGEDPWYTDSVLENIIKGVKNLFGDDVVVTLSIGERSFESYKRLFDAGADRYLLRHETASPEFYKELHPSMSFENRMECLWNLKRIGYQVGAGFIMGLPGQTAEILAEDLVFLKRLDPDMIGIGPFIPHKDTPLGDRNSGSLEATLVILALARLMVPQSMIPATTAIGTIHPQGRELALKAGANVVMPNLTPLSQRVKYELYDNKICTGEEAAECRKCIEKRISASGFEVDMGRGNSWRYDLKSSL